MIISPEQIFWNGVSFSTLVGVGMVLWNVSAFKINVERDVKEVKKDVSEIKECHTQHMKSYHIHGGK